MSIKALVVAMIGNEVKESKPVSITDVEKILEENSGATPTYEQTVALEHAKKITEGKSPEKIRKSLEAMNLMSEAGAIKLLEVWPKNMATLRQALSREKRTYEDADLTKILELFKGAK
jgi:DNA-directed RNA polymerase subunit F